MLVMPVSSLGPRIERVDEVDCPDTWTGRTKITTMQVERFATKAGSLLTRRRSQEMFHLLTSPNKCNFCFHFFNVYNVGRTKLRHAS